MRTLALALLCALACVPQRAAASTNFTIISMQVDADLQKMPQDIWIIASVVGLVVGPLFACSGARSPRFAGFLFGAFTGALVMAFFLSFATVTGEVWLALVASCAVLGGILTAMSLPLIRFALAIGFGFSLSMVVMQYGLSYISHLDPWVAYSITGGCVVLGGLLAWAVFPFALVLTTSLFGGFIALLSVACLMHAQFSFIGWWFNPAYLVSCTTIQCWAPLLVGFTVSLLGFLYQFKRLKPELITDRSRGKDNQVEDNPRESNGSLGGLPLSRV